MRAGRAVFVASMSILILSTLARPAARALRPEPDPAASLPGASGSANSDTALHGPQPFITLLCRYADVAAEPAPPSYFEALLGIASPGLDDYWREVSYDRINLVGSQVAGWYTLPRPRAAYQVGIGLDLDLVQLAHDCTAAADADVVFPAFAGINLVFNSGAQFRGARMELALDGVSRRYGITWIASSRPPEQATFAHEMGHALGLAHTTTTNGEEYRNAWDSMSEGGPCWPDTRYGRIAQHPIAYDADLLGWIAADRRFIAPPDSISSIHLEQLAQPGPAGYLIARIPIPGQAGRFYTVEARRRSGYDAHLLADAVIIHEVDPPPSLSVRLVSRHDANATVASMWTAGTRFVDPQNGIAVTVDADTVTGFDITIYTRGLPWPTAPADMTLAPPGELRFAWEPIAGATGYDLWLDPVGEGRSRERIVRQSSSPGASLTLPAGRYRWAVRALPGGTWSPARNLEVAAAGRRWVLGRPGPATSGDIPARPAVAPGPGQEVAVAWADDQGNPGLSSIRIARVAGGAWQLAAAPDLAPSTRGESTALAAGPQGELYLLWAAKPAWSPTPTEIWAATRDAGGTWQAGVRISDGPPDLIRTEPAVAVDGAGDVYAIWEEYGNGSTGIYFAYRPAGAGWGAVERVSDDPGEGLQASPAIAVDAQGNAHALWVDNRAGHADIYAAYRPAGGHWDAAERFGDDFDAHAAPSVGVDAKGNAYAAWGSYSSCRGRDGSVGQIDFVVRPAGGRWGPIGTVSASVGGLELWNPAMAVGLDGSVFVVWQEAGDGGFVLASAYRPAGGGWGPKILVSDDPSSAISLEPAMAANAAGNADLVWVSGPAGTPHLRLASTAGKLDALN